MALNKARKLFVFVFSFILIVCTFVVLSSAEENSRASDDYTGIETGVAWRLSSFVPDDDTAQGQPISLAFISADVRAQAYFQIYRISTGEFIEGQFFMLQSMYDAIDDFQYFVAYGSYYPNANQGDYTSLSYALNSTDYVIFWQGITDFNRSLSDYLANEEKYFDYFTKVNLADILSGLGYNEGYNNGYDVGYNDGYNEGVLNGDVSLTVGDNSVYIDPSQLTSRFYIEWYAINDVIDREGWFIIFGDSDSIFYVFSESGDLTDATILSTLYTRERGWLNGYGSIINLPLNVVRPSRYATITIPSFATIQTDRDNLVGAISLFDYNVLDERFISSLGEVYRQLGYDDGLEIGNNRGYNRGYSEGYTVGYNAGVFDGSSNSNPKTFNKLGAFLVNSVGSFLDTELFFGFNIGHILAIIVGASLFFLMIKLLR